MAKEFSTQVVGTGFYIAVSDILYAALQDGRDGMLDQTTMVNGLIQLFSQRYGWELAECNEFLAVAELQPITEEQFNTLSAHPNAPIRKGMRQPKIDGQLIEKPARQRMVIKR